MLEIKRSEGGATFEQNDVYKQLTNCLSELTDDDYPTKDQCEESAKFSTYSDDMSMDEMINFVMKNLYSDDPIKRQQSEDLMTKIEKMQNSKKDEDEILKKYDQICMRKNKNINLRTP